MWITLWIMCKTLGKWGKSLACIESRCEKYSFLDEYRQKIAFAAEKIYKLLTNNLPMLNHKWYK